MKDPYYHHRLEQSKAARRVREKVRPLSEEIETASRMLMITIGCLLLITTISFLYIRGHQAAKGYYLQQLELEHEELYNDNKEWGSLVTTAQSFTNLDDTDQIAEMVNPEASELNYVGDITDLASR